MNSREFINICAQYNYNVREIVKVVGKTKQSVYSRMRRLGINPISKNNILKDKEAFIAVCTKCNYNAKAVRGALNVSLPVVYNYMRRYNLKTVNELRSIADEQVLSALNNQGNINKAAKVLGMSHGTLADIIKERKIKRKQLYTKENV